MTKEELSELKVGDVVRNIGSGNAFIIIEQTKTEPAEFLGVRTVTITNPLEWERSNISRTNEPSYTVKLEYFKESGKYYSSGEYTTYKQHMFEIFEEVRAKLEAKNLPGLVCGAQFSVYVSCPNHPQNYPGMVFCKKEAI